MSEVSSADEQSQRFARWIVEHGAAVRGFLLGLTRRADVADDLAQETFRKAWEARDRYQENGRVRSYLLRIADRLATDHARRKCRNEGSLEETWSPAEVVCALPSPDHALAAAEDRQQLHAALNGLSELQRRVLLLRFFGELEFAEIAAQLECPLGTVLSHCHRGLENLRKIMNQ